MFQRVATIAAPLFFLTVTAAGAGDPIPGVDVPTGSGQTVLVQIPGATYKTGQACLDAAGTVVRDKGKTYCKPKRGVGNTDQNGDFTLKTGGGAGKGVKK